MFRCRSFPVYLWLDVLYRDHLFICLYRFPVPDLPAFVVLGKVPDMVSRLLIGDNNLSRFWPAYQFSRPALKTAVLITATDLDALDHALAQSEDKNVVIISVLTSILIDEVNQLEVESSAQNVCDQALTRLLGMCPHSQSTQVWTALFQFLCIFIPWLFSVTLCSFFRRCRRKCSFHLPSRFSTFSSFWRRRRSVPSLVGTTTRMPRSTRPW